MLTLLALTLGANAALADSPRSVLKQVEVRGHGERADVVLAGNFRAQSYAVRTRAGGDVIVIDVADATLEDRDGVTLESTDLVRSANATATDHGVRIELALQKHVTYRARSVDSGLVIALEQLGASDEQTTGTAVVTPAVENSVQPGALALRDLKLEKRDERERVIIELSRPSEFRILPGSVGAARMEIKRAALPRELGSYFTKPELTLLKGVRLKAEGDRVVIEVERAGNASGTALREGNRIVWMFSPGAQAEGGMPKPRTLMAAPAPVAEAEETEVDSEEAASFVSGALLQTKSTGSQKYTGRRIDLDFKDADIHNILRLLSEVGGVNVVTSDDVTGSVTIRMRDVPWDQALDVILQAKGLGAERRGNLIRVAPQDVLEKERELAIARQKQQIELAPLETRLVPVSYATAKDVRPRVQEVMSPRGTVSVDERTNVLIVRDIVDNLDDVEELVRTLDTQTPQVLVEART